MRYAVVISTLVFLAASCPSQPAATKVQGGRAARTYTTWTTLEADKCASAWLIKRFMDRNAQFKFIPAGTLVTEGVPFDTPDSEFRRSGKLCAYQVIVQKRGLKDPALDEIGRIVWDIEVNKWAKKVTKESPGVAAIIDGMILTHDDPSSCLESSFAVFDSLYAHFQGK